MIDPGHGGEDPGAVVGDLREKDLNLEISFILKDLLVAAGFITILTRDSDQYVSLKNRISLANKINGNLFISIHNNASSTQKAGGTETLFYPGSKDGLMLASIVQKELVKRFKRPNRGIKDRDDLYILKHTKMPAILIEIGFITNPTDRHLLKQVVYQKIIAEGIFAGIEYYWGNGVNG